MNKANFTSAAVTAKIGEFEAHTGHELVVVVAHCSDPYPGAQWRGGVLIGLLAAALVATFYDFHPQILEVALVGVFIVLAATGLRLSDCHRFFVLPSEAERESAEKAGVLFSQFQSRTLGHEAAVMLYLSLMEHKMHLLVDKALQDKLSSEDLHEILACLRMHFKRGDFQAGLEKAVGVLQQKILEKVGKNPHPPLLSVPDRIFWLD